MPKKKKLEINRDFLFKGYFKFYKGKRKVDFLVLHHVGSNELNNIGASIDVFREYGVSAHYIISQEGVIYQLVDEKNIAWHAGRSYWRGKDGLNTNSIGIELHSPDPFKIGFTKEQARAGIALCKDIIKRHKIKFEDVVGHSDIGYDDKTGRLDRKQDPSHLFDWKSFAKAGVGIFPSVRKSKKDNEIVCKFGDKGMDVKDIQDKLKKIGYKITVDGEYGKQTEAAVKVFKRRFEPGGFENNCGVFVEYRTRKIMDSYLAKVK